MYESQILFAKKIIRISWVAAWIKSQHCTSTITYSELVKKWKKKSVNFFLHNITGYFPNSLILLDWLFLDLRGDPTKVNFNVL